jgi:hypothetical protein
MNSTVIEYAAVRTHREMIRFQHPDEWQGRPEFRWSLTLTERDVSHFVGGYNLPKELYQLCGLAHNGKPCGQVHGHGFVVASNDGLETQVGQDCGLRHLGAKFEELERLFTAQVKTEDLMKRMRELTSRQGELLARAQKAIVDCDRASAAVAEITHKISRERALESVFKHALQADGSVHTEVRVSQDEFERTRQRYRREVFGRIDGISAATAKSPKFDIQAIVLPLVRSLTAQMLAQLSGRKLAAKSKEAGDAERILIDADAYVALCRRFTSRRNWQAFASAFDAGRIPTNDRGRRVVRQLLELGT